MDAAVAIERPHQCEEARTGLLFRGVLEEALHRFNPWMTKRRRPVSGREHPGASPDH